MRRGPSQGRTGTSALTGRSAVVVPDVSASGGRAGYRRREVVLLPVRREPVIPAGTTVDVIEIDGATAFVYPRE